MSLRHVVESLELTVLIEDYSGYDSRLIAQHGLSIYIKVRSNGRNYGILFDVGTNARHVLANARTLGIDLGNTDYIVLSHCHYDHTGGLIDIVKEICEHGKKPYIIAHPDIFRPNYVLRPHLRHVGIPAPNAKAVVEDLGATWILCRDPIEFIPGVITTGEITEVVDFEKELTTSFYTLSGGRFIHDFMRDEMGLVIRHSKGAVIITGCAHPGIVSIVRRGLEISGCDRVYGVIGGFHLIGASDERIDNVVRSIKDLGVEFIATGHCTGLRAEARFLEVFGDKFRKLHSGFSLNL